ncbi:Hmp Flavodoxin reductases (ferredoxin-NADPH reductases) family 1 [Candidatus Pelagibacterales bacterium]
MIDDNLHKVIGKTFVGNANLILKVEKKNKTFNAGQFFSIGVLDMPINREYSVCNSANDDYIEFYIRFVENGTLSPKLFNIRVGEYIKVLGAYGEFYLKNFSINKKYLFIGTGTGIAPFLSIIKTHNLKNYIIMHGIRELKDQINILNKENYEIYVSKEEVPSQKNIFNGRMTQYIKNKLSEIDKDCLFFLCGNSLMVSETHENLTLNGIKSNKIFTEIFF